jgi:hypothetical protein
MQCIDGDLNFRLTLNAELELANSIFCDPLTITVVDLKKNSVIFTILLIMVSLISKNVRMFYTKWVSNASTFRNVRLKTLV